MSEHKSEVIFTPKEIIEACERSVEKKVEPFLSDVFSIDENVRKTENCQYVSIYCKVGNKRGKLKMRFIEEINSGKIFPNTDAEVTRINADRSSVNKIKKRLYKPTIGIRKFKKDVETEGETIAEEYHSQLYKALNYYNTFFYTEMKRRLKNEEIVLNNDLPEVQKDSAIAVANIKICSFIQKRISFNDKNSPGQLLSNPIARMSLSFDSKSAENDTVFLDGDRPFRDKLTGKRTFCELLFNGKKIGADNIHLLKPRSVVSGLVEMPDICFSNFGISLLTRVSHLVVSAPKARKMQIVDILDMDAHPDDPDEPEDLKPAREASPDSEEILELNEEDLSKVISELTI